MRADAPASPLALAAFASVAAAMLLAAGQPVFTDDLWWHLGLGEAFAQQGPWLREDPLLFTAPGPPDPASWLSDVALFLVWKHAGFTGLRVLHVAWVSGIIALAFSLARRASGSTAVASAIAIAFVALAAYRLVQLRPDLFSILATLGLYRLLCEDGTTPTPLRIAAAAPLFAVWANCHAAFPLGLALLAASALAELAAGNRARAARVAIACGIGFVASLANPSGAHTYLAWFRAGDETPTLSIVADEWARFEPWQLPVANLPPTPLSWVLVWGLLGVAPFVLWAAVRRVRRAPAAGDAAPTQAAWMLVALAALLSAVRFLWLGLFPLLALARASRASVRPAAAALVAVLLVPAFFRLGDWPMVSAAMPLSRAGYAEPYSAGKYYAHAIWFLQDAGLEGRVFTDYPIGGFLGFFGAPRLRAFVNGSLHVTRDAFDANAALRERRGALPGETFAELLDRMQIDVFVGTRLPEAGRGRRPWFYTTAHLEGAPGWLPVFRNADSAVYLRADAHNEANLEQVAAYYAREHVPFDPERGFEPERAIRAARLYAVTHGLVPVQFEELAAAAHGGAKAQRRAAAGWLAALYASLGLYEHAVRLDRATLAADPSAQLPRRRLVWSLLRLGRLDEARDEAAPLAQSPDALSSHIAEMARRAPDLDAEARAAEIARLPLLTRGEALQVMGGMARPEPRTQRATDLQMGSSASATPSST